MTAYEAAVQSTPASPDRALPALDQLCIDTIRTLSMDAVQEASSGHPGTPMALAPVAYCLWQRVLRFDPAHPIWPNRDRFVLSVGHASMLLYSALQAKADLEGALAVLHAAFRDALGSTPARNEDQPRYRLGGGRA